MTTKSKLGGTTVELFIPYEVDGKQITEVVIAPFCFDHTLRWMQGKFGESAALTLMVEVTGLTERQLRQLRYPDTDRVQQEFMRMLPDDIRNDITNGKVPVPQPQLEDIPERMSETTIDGELPSKPFVPTFDPQPMPPPDRPAPPRMKPDTPPEGDANGTGLDLNE